MKFNQKNIFNAVPMDSLYLTEIAFAAKKFWKYPNEYIEKWKDELTITENYISNNIVRCIKINNKIIGFYSIINLADDFKFSSGFMEKGFWLDHMFIFPEFHKNGIGKIFFKDINNLIQNKKIVLPLRIFVDPNATGFYDKIGAKEYRVSGSSIPGRNIPVYLYQI